MRVSTQVRCSPPGACRSQMHSTRLVSRAPLLIGAKGGNNNDGCVTTYGRINFGLPSNILLTDSVHACISKKTMLLLRHSVVQCDWCLDKKKRVDLT